MAYDKETRTFTNDVTTDKETLALAIQMLGRVPPDPRCTIVRHGSHNPHVDTYYYPFDLDKEAEAYRQEVLAKPGAKRPSWQNCIRG